jgi:transcription antitermination factor NusG
MKQPITPETIEIPELETLRWYALYVRSRHEKVVEETLKGKGYSAFSPFYRSLRKRSDRTKEVDLPLFPGYVFCQFDAFHRLPILTTSSVVKIIGSANAPTPIDDSEINSIQAIAKSDRAVQPWPFLREGQRVRIEVGPLRGAEGTLLQMKNKFRLVASISLLQRSVAVEVDRNSVVPVV